MTAPATTSPNAPRPSQADLDRLGQLLERVEDVTRELTAAVFALDLATDKLAAVISARPEGR